MSWSFRCTGNNSWIVGVISDEDGVGLSDPQATCIVNCNYESDQKVRSPELMECHPEIHDRVLTATLDSRSMSFSLYLHNGNIGSLDSGGTNAVDDILDPSVP